MSTHATEVSNAASRSAQPHRREATLPPPVDILESNDGITLQADMPGVSKERLQVRVEGNNLLLEGTVQLDVPESAHAVHADVRSSTYRRRFVLSRELETDKIEASLKDGVLTVHIPKRAELRPRKIEVRS
jgi:HSP20 family molecular chaperone IbpA